MWAISRGRQERLPNQGVKKGKKRSAEERVQEKKKYNESPCLSLLTGEERQGYPSEENLMIVDEGDKIMA